MDGHGDDGGDGDVVGIHRLRVVVYIADLVSLLLKAAFALSRAVSGNTMIPDEDIKPQASDSC